MPISRETVATAEILRKGTNISMADAIVLARRIRGGDLAAAQVPGIGTVPRTSRPIDTGGVTSGSVISGTIDVNDLLEHVLPGSLITAALMNRIIDRVNELTIHAAMGDGDPGDGTVVQPDTSLTLDTPTMVAHGQGTASVSSSGVTLGSGAQVQLTYPATFSTPGTYDVDVELTSGAADYDLRLMSPRTELPLATHGTLKIDPAELPETTPGASRIAGRHIVVALGRRTGSTEGNIELRVKRQDQTTAVRKTLPIKLA